VEDANRRLTYFLESHAKAIDELLRELKSDFLHIWASLLCGASLLIGLSLVRAFKVGATRLPQQLQPRSLRQLDPFRLLSNERLAYQQAKPRSLITTDQVQ